MKTHIVMVQKKMGGAWIRASQPCTEAEALQRKRLLGTYRHVKIVKLTHGERESLLAPVRDKPACTPQFAKLSRLGMIWRWVTADDPLAPTNAAARRLLMAAVMLAIGLALLIAGWLLKR